MSKKSDSRVFKYKVFPTFRKRTVTFTRRHYFIYLDHAQLNLCFYGNEYLMSLFYVHSDIVYLYLIHHFLGS